MNRFPEKYIKPTLILLSEGLNTGWTAACTPGAGAQTGGCAIGDHAATGKNDGFIDPEILQQGL